MKALARRIVPTPWLEAYRRVRYADRQRVYKPCLPVQVELQRGQYAGKRCFIVGTGPSLEGMDLSLLQNEHTMLVNRGFLLKDRGLPHCTFYGLSDKGAYREYGADIPDDFARHVCLFGSIPWGGARRHLNVMPMYGASQRRKYMSEGFFQFDLRKPVAHTYTVVLQMLQVAVYAGFTEI